MGDHKRAPLQKLQNPPQQQAEKERNNKMKKFELDMTKGSIFKNTILFAIPLMLTSILQLLYNAADLIVVSRFAGSNAMASVGATASITNLILNVSIGLSVGGGVVVARKFGEKDEKGMHRAVHTAILLAVIMGVVSCIAGLVFSRPLLILTGAPEGEVLDGAELYMKIIFLGVPASVVFNFAAAILRALGDTKRPLYILGLTGIVNVILNLVLVIVFHMDVAGVAIGTIVANYLSAIAVLVIFVRSKESYKLEFKKLRIYKRELATIIKIGLPAGIQGSLFSLSNTVIQSAINSFGAAAIAASAASVNIESFLYVSLNAFYQTVLTSVSQNYGACNKERINKSIYVTMLCAVVVGVVLGLICVIFSKQLVGIYITDSPQAFKLGEERVRLVCATYFILGVMEVLTGALRGLGCSTITAISTFFGVCGVRIFWAAALLPMYRSLNFLFICLPVSWLIVSILHFITLLIIKPRVFRKMKNN